MPSKLAIPHLQNQPPEKYASSTQSSPVSAVIPQLGSAAVSIHVTLKRAPEGWKMALPSRPPTRFPRSQANSIPPRAPRRARTHARYVRNILNIIFELLRRQLETAALLEARAAARCLSCSQCLPKRDGHASSQTATSKFLPPAFGALRSCRASSSASTFHSEQSTAAIQPGNASRTRRTRRRAAETFHQQPPSTLDPRPVLIISEFITTEPSCLSHIRASRRRHTLYNAARAKSPPQAIFRPLVTESRRALAARGRVGSAYAIRKRLLRLQRLCDVGRGT